MRNNKYLLFLLMGLAGGAAGSLCAELVDLKRATFARLIFDTALWSAIFTAVLTVGLFWAGEIYRRRPNFPVNLVRKAVVSGALAGALAGAIAQFIYSIPMDSEVMREFAFKPACWGLMGGLLGWRLSKAIPNLGLARGVAGGLLGGSFGGLGFILSTMYLPELLGRMLGVGILGAALGLAIVTIEAIFRQASLEIIWAPKESTSVTLGTIPVYIGGGDDHIYIAGLPQHAAGVILENGAIHYIDSATGKRTPLKNGSQIKIGKVTLVVRAKS